jgi:uncharacterized membrane protein
MYRVKVFSGGPNYIYFDGGAMPAFGMTESYMGGAIIFAIFANILISIIFAAAVFAIIYLAIKLANRESVRALQAIQKELAVRNKLLRAEYNKQNPGKQENE